MRKGVRTPDSNIKTGGAWITRQEEKNDGGWEHELANPRAELHGDWVKGGIKSGVRRFDGVCQEK